MVSPLEAFVNEAGEGEIHTQCLNCDEYAAAALQINNAVLRDRHHGGPSYVGPRFQFCPFCGHPLKEVEGHGT